MPEIFTDAYYVPNFVLINLADRDEKEAFSLMGRKFTIKRNEQNKKNLEPIAFQL